MNLQTNRVSRRTLFGGGQRSIVGRLPASLPTTTLAAGGGQRDVLVHIYLRGGADGLTLCVPYGDDDLYVGRPGLAIQPPGQVDGALDLDGFFGLAPASAPLLTPYQAGKLAFVHASGSTDPTRSHFDAQYRMETATPNQPLSTLTSGWLGRHLDLSAPVGSGLLRGAALDPTLARTLVGGPATLPIPDPGNFIFPGNPGTAEQRKDLMGNLYQLAQEPLRSAASDSIAVIDLLASIDFAGYVPANGAVYPQGEFGDRLRSSATLIKAEVGVEALQVDLGGWDHHSNMGPLNGTLAGLLAELSQGLEAFYLDLQNEFDRVAVVVMSEFGRRIRENGSAGTDHGYGGCMLVMGGAVQGGQVFADWPGLDTSSGSGDLDSTTDYRDVLWEILSERLDATDLAGIFPGFVPSIPLGIVR